MPTRRVRIGRYAVHVWVCDPMRAPVTDSWLTGAERERLDRLRREEDRTRFVAGRWALRTLVAAYTGCGPADVAVVLDPQGKPSVTVPDGGAPQVSLAHSGARVLVALARRPVGVDVERVRDRTPGEGLLRRVATPSEVPVLLTLPEAERETAFLAVWTRREAVGKAYGVGLQALPPGRVWSRPVPVGDGYLGAVAVAGARHARLRVRALTDPPVR